MIWDIQQLKVHSKICNFTVVSPHPLLHISPSVSPPSLPSSLVRCERDASAKVTPAKHISNTKKDLTGGRHLQLQSCNILSSKSPCWLTAETETQ